MTELQTKELDTLGAKKRNYYIHNIRVAYQLSRDCGKGRVASLIGVMAAAFANFFYGPFDPRDGK